MHDEASLLQIQARSVAPFGLDSAVTSFDALRRILAPDAPVLHNLADDALEDSSNDCGEENSGDVDDDRIAADAPSVDLFFERSSPTQDLVAPQEREYTADLLPNEPAPALQAASTPSKNDVTKNDIVKADVQSPSAQSAAVEIADIAEVPAAEAVHPAAVPEVRVTAPPAAGPTIAIPLEAVPPEPMVLRGRYILERKIGLGGTSVIYRARDVRREIGGGTLDCVALKMQRDESRDKPQALARLKREFKHAQELSHPNIVRVFDLDCEAGTWFMTMELLEGQTLAKALQKGKQQGTLPIDGYHVLGGCAQALDYAHAKGVVHWDFKPANIFITQENEIRLLDFGSACAYRQRFDAAKPRSATVIYASPQVLQGEAAEPRDDVFSFACVAYEVLTGHHPFERQSALQAREAGLQLPRRSPLSVRQWRALRTALSWQRDQRPATTRELYRLLRPAAVGARTLEFSARVVEKLTGHGNARHPWWRRNLLPFGIGAAILIWSGAHLLAPEVPRTHDSKGAPAVHAASIPVAPSMAMGMAESTPASVAATLSTPSSKATLASDEDVTVRNVAAPFGDGREFLSQTGLSQTGQFQINLSQTGEAALPGSAAAGVTVVPARPRPAIHQQIGFAESSLTVSQRANAAVVALVRQNGNSGRVRVSWQTVDGSARSGIDYEGVSEGTTEFADQESQRVLYIALKEGERVGHRSFFVELKPTRAGGSAQVNGITRVPVTIVDY